jgi:hypothetical protein
MRNPWKISTDDRATIGSDWEKDLPISFSNFSEEGNLDIKVMKLWTKLGCDRKEASVTYQNLLIALAVKVRQ